MRGIAERSLIRTELLTSGLQQYGIGVAQSQTDSESLPGNGGVDR